ncbi:ABC transporter permease [Leifsonia sp. A12D58]|uniref:ABC transporter permease n=1 Tax=Leifsonia sp. A12D58 TaxID=3397674 RepID=UPI0039E0479C
MSTLTVLLRQRIRRDRMQLAIWIIGIGLLALFSASAVEQTYGDAAGREGIIRLAVSNPAILMLRGVPQGSGLDAVVFFQIFTFLALMAGLMSTFLAVRHTRGEEESLRVELTAATPAARMLPTVATLIHGVIANLVLGVIVALAFIVGGLEVSGSIITGAATAMVGIAFLTVGMLAAQFMRTSRGANGLSVALVGAAYLLRGLGDALGTPSVDGLYMTSAWPSWLSSIGWAQQTSPFSSPTLAPLLLCLALAAVCAGAVFVLQASRDSGASLLPERSGRADARSTLSGSFGLAWRLQWPTIVGWAIGAAATGLLAGLLAKLVVAAAQTDPTLDNALRSIVPGVGGSADQVLVSALFSIVGVLAAACATQVIIRMHQEESAGMAEALLATPLARVRWFVDYLVLGLVSVVIVLVVAAVFSSLGILASGTDTAMVGGSFAAAAAQLPAALVYLGILALIFVILPAFTLGLGWTVLGLGGFIGIFGGLIGLPEWLRNVSPFTHTPLVVGTDTDWTGGLWMLAVALVACAIAVVGMRRRDIRGT